MLLHLTLDGEVVPWHDISTAVETFEVHLSFLLKQDCINGFVLVLGILVELLPEVRLVKLILSEHHEHLHDLLLRDQVLIVVSEA